MGPGKIKQPFHLLIVDDEVLLADNLRYILGRHFERVSTAHNGLAALELMQQQTFDCVVSDVNMPVMGGIELVRSARSLGFTTPFIFYSAYASDEILQETLKYGVYCFVNKPDFEGLEAAVHRGFADGFVRRT
jgi:YesN/AraC family two-component response regulator